MISNSPSFSPESRPSCLRQMWNSVCLGLVVANLFVVILGSALVLYDADTFWITPIMPDADERTACDKNYVCEALRGLVNLYAFTCLLMGSVFLYTTMYYGKYRRFIQICMFFGNLGHLLAYARMAHLNLIFWNNIMLPFIISFILTFLHGLMLSINADLDTPTKT
jgi:hypothetical protein